MSCPECGGHERRQSRPTTSSAPLPSSSVRLIWCPTRISRREVDAPWIRSPHTCGHRYQEGPASISSPATCRCGIFAIGVCTECSNSVCGACAEMSSGNLVCSKHVQERQQLAAEEAKRQSKEKQRIEREEQSRTQLTNIAFVRIMNESGNPGAQPFFDDDEVIIPMTRSFSKRYRKAFDAEERERALGKLHRGETRKDVSNDWDRYKLQHGLGEPPVYGWAVGQSRVSNRGNYDASTMAVVVLTSGELRLCYDLQAPRPLLKAASHTEKDRNWQGPDTAERSEMERRMMSIAKSHGLA